VAEPFDADTAIAELVASLPTPPSRADELARFVLSRAELEKLPAPTWIVAEWFAESSLGVVYGKPGGGKTFATVDLACSLATGADWLGHRTSPRDCLYVAGEGVSGLNERITAWERHHQRRADRLHTFRTAVDLTDEANAVAIATLVERFNVGHVTVDTLNRCLVGEENTSRDMGAFVAGCDTIRSTGAAVAIVHHDSRAGGNPRGSSVLDGAADTICEVTADGTLHVIRCTKQKEAEPPPPLYVRRNIDGASCYLTPNATQQLEGTTLDMLRALVEMDAGSGITSAEWRTATGVAIRSFNRKVKWLVDHGYGQMSGGHSRGRYAATDLGRRHVE
jgi:AAA domain-containing protein